MNAFELTLDFGLGFGISLPFGRVFIDFRRFQALTNAETREEWDARISGFTVGMGVLVVLEREEDKD